MRKGSYSLAGLVSAELDKDPLKGDVFIFLSASGRQVKILCFQGDGFGLYQKRLERGTFERPVIQGTSARLTAAELRFLMDGIVLKSIQRRVRYKAPECAKVSN